MDSTELDWNDSEEMTPAVEEVNAPDTLVLRAVPDTIPLQLQRKKEFAYANDPAWWKKKDKKNEEGENSFLSGIDNFFQSARVRMIAYILLILLMFYIVYRVIVVNKLYLFYNSRERKEDEEDVEVFSDNQIQEKIDSAIAIADYRSAVRYLFIQVLQLLHQKGMIRYQFDATNANYIEQMKPTSHASIFQFLTQVYEYVWYGKFNLSLQQFEKIHASFVSLKKSFNA